MPTMIARAEHRGAARTPHDGAAPSPGCRSPHGQQGDTGERAFGVALRRYRRCLGLSQNALAKVVGIDASYINRLESGEREAPSRRTALALARALQLSRDDVDRLLCSAGYLPPSLHRLGPTDSTVCAVARVLADGRLSPEVRADFRAVVETIAYRWQRLARQEPPRQAAAPGYDRGAADPVPATGVANGREARAAACTRGATQPTGVASLAATRSGSAR